MATENHPYLSKRFQQIMELAYEKAPMSAADLERELPGSPANSTVRTQLRQLEERGLLRHYEKDGRFLYVPTEPPQAVAKSAMKKALKAYFNGSLELAFSTLLSAKETDIDDEEFERLRKVIDEAAEAQKES
jgi:predicted transcriptional regulator